MNINTIFYGDNPASNSANANINRVNIEELLNANEDTSVVALCYNSFSLDKSFKMPNRLHLTPIGNPMMDPIGNKDLMDFMAASKYNLFYSNNDIYRLYNIAKNSNVYHERTGFKWAQMFPVDCDEFVEEWFQIMKLTDLPITYSYNGYKLYKDRVPKLKYYKYFVDGSVFKKSEKTRSEIKKELFGFDDKFIVACVGKNMIRKDFERAIAIFKKFSKKHNDTLLYLHTEINDHFGMDLGQLVDQYGLQGRVAFKQAIKHQDVNTMVRLYNAVDVLLVTSVAEGLCVPILEAQLCECPVVAPLSTGMRQLVNDGKAYAVRATNEMLYIPISSMGKNMYVPRRRCNLDRAVEFLEEIYTKGADKNIIKRGYEHAQEYTKAGEFAEIMEPLMQEIRDGKKEVPERKTRVLFMQHESAGDVLLTTGVLRNLREKHPGMLLDYMTSDIYRDIVENNLYINEIVKWDPEIVKDYAHVYYPHQVIRRGNWGAGDTPLSRLYSDLCSVEYTEMFIDTVRPKNQAVDVLEGKNYIVIHNNGGTPHRFYPFMDKSLESLCRQGLIFVQVGGGKDPKVNCAVDLRGKLSFRETAWVMANAKMFIGVDSFPAHLAACLHKVGIIIYSSQSRRIIKPEYITVDIRPNYSLVCPIIGPCSGNYNDCNYNCIKSINPEIITSSVRAIYDTIINTKNESDLPAKIENALKDYRSKNNC